MTALSVAVDSPYEPDRSFTAWMCVWHQQLQNKRILKMINLFKYLAIMAVVALTGAHHTLAADPAYCEGYATTAVGQYQIAIAKGIPDIGGLRWHGDRNGHYWWCTLPITSEQQADAEIAVRNEIISKY
jgi:hypothetical protein